MEGAYFKGWGVGAVNLKKKGSARTYILKSKKEKSVCASTIGDTT